MRIRSTAGIKSMNRLCVLAILFAASSSWASQRYSASGMVMNVDSAHNTMVVSCDPIPDYMGAMTMPFTARDSRELTGLTAGKKVEFDLVVESESYYAEHIRIREYESVEQDPLTARRLKLQNRLSKPASPSKALAVGEIVPNFTLTDQARRPVSLSQFAGKVVAVNFIYTSCALPTYCFRISNNFGVLKRRFQKQLGTDLILLTVTFDPVRDQPEVLAHYAATWKADPNNWHFLTGSPPDVQRVTSMFGVDVFPDEGLMNHSLHTAILDRTGRVAANIEGNQFTADQLADLVQTVMGPQSGAEGKSAVGVHPPVK
jgi:protein SCO1